MKLKFLSLLFIIALINTSFSQNKEPELTINLLANDKIADVNVDQNKFIKSITKITDYCRSNFKNIPENQKIGILIIIHKNGQPTYKCYSKPKLDKNLQEQTLKDLNELQIENTKLVDFPILVSINVKENGGVIDFDNYEDPIKYQYVKYESADLQTKFKLIKEYAINEVLPVLSAYQVIVDDKFEGVKKFGKTIELTDFNKIQNIDALTSTNKNYWRATMEMEIGNQLIPITKIFTLASQGELDYAQKYIEIILMFSDSKTTSDQYLKEISYRINLFNQELQKQIENGITEHDKGNYQDAIKIYDGILKIYPNSSWALYEKYYSDNAKKISENKVTNDDRVDWDNAKVGVYKHNPLYNMDVRASNGREGYLLFRRQEISGLFKKKDERLNDLFKYAEIATDLGIYDFAAQLFWLTATFAKGDPQKSINNYLYCLDKLGERELKSNFKGDYNKVFESIEKNKEKEMKSSSIYKSMKN
ncbi:MAG TPA: hypothetical protein VIM65_12215 [Cyclobacteriaceae bacterium]